MVEAEALADAELEAEDEEVGTVTVLSSTEVNTVEAVEALLLETDE